MMTGCQLFRKRHSGILSNVKVKEKNRNEFLEYGDI